jgi:hypothetical protein
MTVIVKSQGTNFHPRPQNRKIGSGKGRKNFDWIGRLPWVLVAAEQLFVLGSGSEGGLLEQRHWVKCWNLTPRDLRCQLGKLFPGLPEYVESIHPNPRSCWALLKGRVYKMYYNGTSARGFDHDPMTRASISREYWRSHDYATKWGAIICLIVSRRLVVRCWRKWL